MIVWYFAITTLSTVGFGDFHPVNTQEKIVTAFIMLVGVSVFSFIMGSLIEILHQYRDMHKNGDGSDLTQWLSLLAHFNGSKPLNRELVSEIEDFFEYYWQNDKHAALRSKE